MNKELILKLKNPIKAAANGEMKTCKEIVITSPTVSIYQYYYPLRHLTDKPLFDAMQKQEKHAASDAQQDKKDLSNEDLSNAILALLMLQNVDLTPLIKILNDLLVEGQCAKLDNKIELTQPLFDQLSLADIELILGAYIGFFMSTS